MLNDCICGGAGWMSVDEDYVRRHAAGIGGPVGTALPAGLLEALRNSVLPCPDCRPTAYRLWAEGHFRPGHVCATCRPRRGGGGRPKRKAAA